MCTMNGEKVENMKVYDAFRTVPESAKKTIQGGPLKGFTDINPMWRLKQLTEVFGPCGKGWKIENVDFDTLEGPKGEIGVFCTLNLYVRYQGEWSEPIFGVGGSRVVVDDSRGAHLDDEGYKKAYTDAISIACKALGMCADIYFAADVKTTDNLSKYDTDAPAAAPAPQQAEPAKPAAAVKPSQVIQPAYQPLDNETYWRVVASAAVGKKAKSGRTYREDYISMTNADAAAIRKFDDDVAEYKIANSLN
jgi:hypothetical protein